MKNEISKPRPLPHHTLLAFRAAEALVQIAERANIQNKTQREQVLDAAMSAARNTAEGVGRSGVRDKRNRFSIARGEFMEAVVGIELAIAAGIANREVEADLHYVADRGYALLTGLVRKAK